MFPSDEFWKGAMLQVLVFSAVIGGIITVLLLKLCERKGAAKTGAGHKSNKQPVEHDERF